MFAAARRLRVVGACWRPVPQVHARPYFVSGLCFLVWFCALQNCGLILLCSCVVVSDCSPCSVGKNNHAVALAAATRLIGRRFDDASVQHDMKLWPFKVQNDGVIAVQYTGQTKHFKLEEVSAMVLGKKKQQECRCHGCALLPVSSVVVLCSVSFLTVVVCVSSCPVRAYHFNDSQRLW